MKTLIFGLGAVGLLLVATASGRPVKLPAIYGDHMVLQSGAPVPVWGMGTPRGKITVAFAGQSQTAQADANGYWNVTLAPLSPAEAPAEFTVTEAAQPPLVIHDVLVGEVWLAGGQSNMAFGLNSMQGKEGALAAANNPKIRLFNVKHLTAADPVGLHPDQVPGDLTGRWELSDPKTAGAFSAVAYLFGLELQQTRHGAVGLISSNWGGTPIQVWMSREAFARDQRFSNYVKESDEARALHQRLASDPANDARYQQEWRQWRKEVGEAYDAAMKQWNAANESGKDAGPRPKLSRPEPNNPDPTAIPNGGYRPHSPSIGWNAMYAPLAPYAVRGALWYQGEANVSQYKEYGPLLRALVTDWRRQFNHPGMDFFVVQLPANGVNDTRRTLAHFREAQASVLALPHTGLAITFDVGDPGNVHPASKVDIAHRLTRLALAQTYGQPIPCTGPVFESAQVEGDSLRVTFSHVAGRLVIGQAPWLSVHTAPFPLDRVIGFEIAGEDRVFAPATAMIEAGNQVILRSEAVRHPREVRYAFDNSPRANLYDESGLPTAPFRTDSEP